MSWICKQCETLNTDDTLECEVCCSVAPLIRNLFYSNIDVNKLTSISWDAIEYDEIILIFKGKEYDVTDKTSIELLIEEDSTISFRISNSVAIKNYSFPIYISPPQILDFSVDKLRIIKGDSIRIHWNVINSNYVELEGFGKQHLQGEIIVPLERDEIKIFAKNSSVTISKVLKINLLEKTNINIKLSNKKIRKGKSEHSILSWNIKYYASAKLLVDDKEIDIKSSGKEIVNPTKTTTYKIQAVGLDNKTIFSKRVTLYVLSDTDIEFTVNKQYTYPRIPVMLSWKVEHAKFVELVGYGNVEHEGSKIVDVEKDTIFRLKVTGAFGVKTKELLVKVLPLPMIKSLLVPTPKINNRVLVNFNQTIIQPFVEIPTNLHTNIDIPPLIEPNFNDLSVKMIEPIEYHPLHVNLNNDSWWNKIWNRIKSIKSFKN